MYLKLWRCVVADILYLLIKAPVRELVDEDVRRFLKWDPFGQKHTGRMLRLNYCLLYKKEFRSVFHLRTRQHRIPAKLCGVFLPRVKTIELGSDGIGGGFLVSHYHCVVFPKKTGNNFRVGPGVVIGKNGGFPTFGDNVYVAANATVIGDIQIGSNVIIGAGSVVTKDVPGNCVVAGNPARVIRTIDDDPRLLNEIM